MQSHSVGGVSVALVYVTVPPRIDTYLKVLFIIIIIIITSTENVINNNCAFCFAVWKEETPFSVALSSLFEHIRHKYIAEFIDQDGGTCLLGTGAIDSLLVNSLVS